MLVTCTGNIFLDAEGNIKLGDFGLATRNREKAQSDNAEEEDNSETGTIYKAIDDISHLLGGSQQSGSRISSSMVSGTSVTESLTGGVGTGASTIGATMIGSFLNHVCDLISLLFWSNIFRRISPSFATVLPSLIT